MLTQDPQGPRRSRQMPGPQPLQGAWRRSCSNSTSTATRARSATARCRRGWRRRPTSPSRTVPSSPSRSSKSEGEAMSARPPVKDWATDFDHLDPRWVNDPFPIWDEMRKTCPIAHTERFMGVYFPSRYEDVRAVAYDTEHFSSRRVIVRETPPPRIPAPPITSDPPEHRPARMVLLPPFTPDAIKKLEPRARALCNELIDKFIARGDVRCRGRVRAGNPGPPHRPHAGPAGERRRPLPQMDQDGPGGRHHRCQHRRAGRRRDAALFHGATCTSAMEKPGDDLISYLSQRRVQGREADRRERDRLAAAAADRRHRHHLERHRLLHLALRQDARGPPAAGRGPRADADGHRGVPARLRARHHGTRGGEGDRRSTAAPSSRGRWCCCPSPPPAATRRCSPTPTRS